MASNTGSPANSMEKQLGTKGYDALPITDVITNGFFTVDKKWTVKYWNKAAEKILNVQAGEIVGKNLWEVFADVIPLEFYAVYHKAFLQDIPVHFEEYWGEMGSWFDVITYYCDDTLSVSFKSSNGRPDVQENLLERLKTLTELYRFVTEVTNDCLWEWDLRSRELFWIDGGHRRAFGYQIENAVIPQNFWEGLLHPDDKARILTSLHKTIGEGSGEIWEAEYRLRKANGDYAFVHDRGHIIYGEDSHPVRMIGATRDITAQVLLEKKLEQERQERQKEITAAVLIAEEKERSIIGRQLHDNVNQILTVVKLYVELARTDEAKRDSLLTRSSGFIMEAIEEIRKISKSIASQDISTFGLSSCIKRLIDDINTINLVKIKFTSTVPERDIDETLQLNMFRILQEHMTNILKHAEATFATIHISKQENNLVLEVSDNGRGCDASEKRKGVGIRNIMSRAEAFDGNATIDSEPGKGFHLKVLFPIPVMTELEEMPPKNV